MSTDSDAAARRIMNQFGEESRIPYLNIDEGDVGVLIAVPIIAHFVHSRDDRPLAAARGSPATSVFRRECSVREYPRPSSTQRSIRSPISAISSDSGYA